MTTLTQSMVNQLSKAIDSVKQKKQALLFTHPVDHVGMGLHDYLDVVKRPMDLTTLKDNLEKHYYQTFESFIRDMQLIFKNCQDYNGRSSDGFYYKQAEDCEHLMIQTIAKNVDFQFNENTYRLILQNKKQIIIEPLVQAKPLNFSIFRLQSLIVKMDQLNPQDLTQCMQWYCRTKQISFELSNLKIKFNTSDIDVLQKLEQMVENYLPKRKRTKQ